MFVTCLQAVLKNVVLDRFVNVNVTASASEMTYIVSSGALNSTHSPLNVTA